MSNPDSDVLVPPAEQSGAELEEKVLQLRRSNPSIAPPPPLRPAMERECSILDESSFRQ